MLHNKFDKKILKQQLAEETFKRVTVSFYRYVMLDNPDALRDQLFAEWTDLNAFGRIYLAKEGINAQMSVPEDNWTAFEAQVNSHPEFKDVPFKIAVEDDGKSFYKLKVKVRKKLVADGLNDGAFDVTNVGKHLTAKEFNEAMAQKNAVVVDMRNHYESEVGHFEGAICPDVDTFREELPHIAELLEADKDKKLLLYCTGGIRCEKASAYFRHLGFEDVNQLHGGVIDYVRQVKGQGLENKFIGKNFVFDERLGERVSDEVISKCHQCGEVADSHTNCKNEDCHILFIQCEKCAEQHEGCCSPECTAITHLSEDEQRELRRGKERKAPRNVYRKGRLRPKLSQEEQVPKEQGD